jgi:hypothetical protein
MKKDFLKKNLTITLITILILTSTTVAGYKTIDEIRDIDDGFINQITNQKVITEELKQEISDLLNNNNSNRYLIITGGIRASSYFVKLPRLLTQRGLIFSGEIWYRSSLAVTFIFEKNNSRLKLVDFERGTHRLFVFGIGHSTFSRPHFFSCGRLTAITRIKPIII